MHHMPEVHLNITLREVNSFGQAATRNRQGQKCSGEVLGVSS